MKRSFVGRRLADRGGRSLLEVLRSLFAAGPTTTNSDIEARDAGGANVGDVSPARRGSERTTADDHDRTDREPLRVLLVGPVRATGGIARYIDELRTRLPPAVAVAVYDTAAPAGSGPVRFVRGLVGALGDAVRFPFHPRPDVVHIQTAEEFSFLRKSAYVLLTRYVWDRPTILHIHGPTFDRFVSEASTPMRGLQRVVFAASTAIVVLSPHWQAVLGSSLPEHKVEVLRNAIDTTEYDPRFEPSIPHVVFVANHVPRKGIREFTDAIERLMRRGANCRVSIAGSGPLDDRSERLAAEYDRVEYLGYVTETTKRELLCEASIYVLPAYAEGLPIGVLEGMAGGNAIVATAVGGVPDLVDESGGCLISPRDPGTLADAIADLVATPGRVGRMGRYNTERVENYTWERVLPRLIDLYERVAADSAH
jgi:glycosyltransferase involved in cell wall biosynthesis